MKKRVFVCVLTLTVMLMPALVLAEDPRDLGYLVIDQEGMQTYLIHEDWESIQHAMGKEEITNAAPVKAKPRPLQTRTHSDVGPDAWFSVSGGESPTFFVVYDIITGEDFTLTLQVKGPGRYRETFVNNMSLWPGSWITALTRQVPDVPGYYKYSFKLKGRGGGVVKGSYSVIP
jgi:hypothetical protein